VILTSDDSGATWAGSAHIDSWHGIASSADGTKLVAVVEGGQIYTSDCAGSGAGTPDCSNDATATCTLDATRANGDPQFTATNIADGVNVLGVTGTLTAGGGGCTAPVSCPNVGDLCSDGSLFAGFMLYDGDSCEGLYVTNNNQSTSSQWRSSGSGDNIDPDDQVDGQANHANRTGTLSNFPAFNLCESNTYHGKTDWYLPAREELYLLWRNQDAINANAAGDFTVDGYWSSTEVDATYAAPMVFGDGDPYYNTKTTSNDVRCVRRD
jgi:hypothetical protein